LNESKNINIGKTYHNTIAADNFLQAIADIYREDTWDYLAKCPFFCLIGDGSTDNIIKEQGYVS
jgi:hypothetical protein